MVSAVAEEEESPDMTGQLQAAVVAPLWGEMEGLLRERLEGMTLDGLLRRAQARGLKRPSTEPLNFAI